VDPDTDPGGSQTFINYQDPDADPEKIIPDPKRIRVKLLWKTDKI
jgi:hypothetical protein